MQTQNYERVNITVPTSTIGRLRKTISPGKRSSFIVRAIEKELAEKERNIYEELLKARAKGRKASLSQIAKWVQEDRARN